MADSAKVNLMDLDDVMAERAPGTDGRGARRALGSRNVGVSRFTCEPDVQSTFAHRHVGPEVVWAFAAGPDGLDLVAVGGPRPDRFDGPGTAEWPDA